MGDEVVEVSKSQTKEADKRTCVYSMVVRLMATHPYHIPNTSLNICELILSLNDSWYWYYPKRNAIPEKQRNFLNNTTIVSAELGFRAGPIIS